MHRQVRSVTPSLPRKRQPDLDWPGGIGNGSRIFIGSAAGVPRQLIEQLAGPIRSGALIGAVAYHMPDASAGPLLKLAGAASGSSDLSRLRNSSIRRRRDRLAFCRRRSGRLHPPSMLVGCLSLLRSCRYPNPTPPAI